MIIDLRRILTFLLVPVALSTPGCGLFPTEPDRPTRADIAVEGTGVEELELVVSTSFFEVIDEETFELSQVLLTADTTRFRPPHSTSVALTSLGMVLVRVVNPAPPTAQVRLRVDLDSGQRYDEMASLDQGMSHTWYFIFNPGLVP